jgi:hypothetical protein
MHASANIVEIKIRWKVGKTFLSFTSVIQDNCKDMVLIVIVQKMAFQFASTIYFVGGKPGLLLQSDWS